MAVKAIPDGFHAITPHMVIKGAADAIDYYKKAFGATEIMRMPAPDGKRLMHAEIMIGGSILMLSDEFPEYGGGKSPVSLGGTCVTINLYVDDCDGVFNRAVAAGATVKMPPTDMFWGDRYGQVVDPFGHVWALATHKEDLTPEQIGQRAAAAFSK